jgi:hypothetical protein
MEVDMKFPFRTTIVSAATAAIVSAAVPAQANDGRYRGRDGIDAGDVIAGALIIGGIAAIASAGSQQGWNHGRYDDRRHDDRRHYNDDYGYFRNGHGSRSAVNQCVRAAEQEASRYGRARITDVTSIYRIRGGYEVRGRLVVAGRYYRGRDYDRWDRYGYRYDRYGNDYDKGRFSCVTRFGGVENVRLAGLRG